MLTFFQDNLDARDVLGLQARAVLLLLQTLIEDNEIFTYVKPPSTGKKPVSAAKTKSKGNPDGKRVTRGQMGKSFSRNLNIRDDESMEDEVFSLNDDILSVGKDSEFEGPRPE